MGVKSRLIGCEDGPFRHVRACWGWGNLLYYKGPLCLLLCLLCSQKFWPLFCEESLLQEVKPGVQCPTEDQEWHRREQRDIGGEGQCQERHGSTGRYGSCSSHLLFTLNSMCFFFFLFLFLHSFCCIWMAWRHCWVCTESAVFFAGLPGECERVPNVCLHSVCSAVRWGWRGCRPKVEQQHMFL